MIWDDFENPVTMPDGTVLLELTFLISGGAGSISQLSFLNCELSDELGDVVTCNYIDGSVEITACPPPDQVSGVNASDDLCHAVSISWLDVEGETGYMIFRDGSLAGTTVENDTILTDIPSPGQFEYTVQAFITGCGEAEQSEPDFGTRLGPPEDPQWDTIPYIPQCDGIYLNWFPVENATGYKVYREGVQIATISTSSYTDNAPGPGAYSYSVIAFNQCGNSIPSSSRSFSRLGTPEEVTNLMASDTGCSIVFITWNDTDNEDGYHLFRNGDNIETLQSNETAFLDVPGSLGSYTYAVQAYNLCGDGPVSGNETGTILPSPERVLTLSASDTICEQIDLHWSDVEFELFYLIYRDDLKYDSVDQNTNDWTDSNVSPNTNHIYKIVAGNNCAIAEPSPSVTGVGLATLDPPSSTAATDDLCNEVIVTWTDIDFETEYWIYRDDTFISVVDQDIIEYVDTMPEPGTHSYKIRARNVCGLGTWSNAAEGSRLSTYTAEFEIAATTDSCNFILVEWSDIEGEDGYRLYRDGEQIGVDLPANMTVYQDNSAVAGIDYNYRISAFEDECESQSSDNIPGRRHIVPGTVVGLTVSNDDCENIIINWDDLSLEDGYEVYRDNDLLSTVESNITTFTDVLPDLGPHAYAVRAFNLCGNGNLSEEMLGSRFGQPGQVDGYVASVDICESIELQWEDLDNENGYVIQRNALTIDTVDQDVVFYLDQSLLGVHSYTIYAINECGDGPMSDSTSGEALSVPTENIFVLATSDSCNLIELSWNDVANETGYNIYRNDEFIGAVAANETTFRDTPIQGSHSYNVAAINECGEGIPSQPVPGTGLETLPAVPQVDATDTLCGIVVVTWSAVVEADSFQVRRNGERIGVVHTDTLVFTDSDAIPGVHLYAVVAYNACGAGDASGVDEGAIHSSIDPLQAISASETICTHVLIDWETGNNVDYYTVSRDGDSIGTVSSEQSDYQDFSAIPGIVYDYTVTAWNVCGLVSSEPDQGQIPASVSHPAGLVAEDGCESILLAWEDATNEDYYLIFRNGEWLEDTLESNTTSFLDESPQNGENSYVVKAENSCGSEESDAADANSYTEPGIPTNVTVGEPECDQISMTWNEAEGDVEFYNVFRDEMTEPIGNVDGSILEYIDSTLDDPYDHNYFIQAANSLCGVSAGSDPVIGNELSLFEFEMEVPDTVLCQHDTLVIDVSFCEGINSLVISLIEDDEPDIPIAVVTNLTNPMTIIVPDIGRVAFDAQVKVIAYRGARSDTVLSNAFFIDCLMSSDNADPLIPNEFYLAQNYPNPFNPSTTIEFGLPKLSSVSIIVYDILGRQVDQLISGSVAAGYHSLVWNCSQFSSGIYLIVMETPDFRSVKKAMFLH